ncbi:MAG: hypothetical protein KTR35_02325 [Gammaproteobacteria bacterium]|nr:hypothetical protein [Gammaproteobacteria bacterium]
MKIGQIKIGILLLVSLFVMSCSSSNKDADTSGGASYIGNWMTECALANIAGIQDTYFIYEIRLATDGWQYVQSGYLDENCTSQTEGNEETGGSARGTLTMAGTFNDSGSVTTSDGLEANNLSLNIATLTNTLDESESESSPLLGETIDVLVFVNDADILYIDGGLIIDGTAGALALNHPFTRQ